MNRIEGHFRDFPLLQHAIAVKIDYHRGHVNPLSPAEQAQQQVRVWHFIRNPAGGLGGLPHAILAQPPLHRPAYPWHIGAAWAAPARGHYVIELPTACLADPATALLPAAAVGQNFTLDMYEVYSDLQSWEYLP